MVDLPGQFYSRDGHAGVKATITDVNYNEQANFNLFSLTRCLISGWYISSGNQNGVVIEDGNGGRIEFDIVILTRRGAIFACRFI